MRRVLPVRRTRARNNSGVLRGFKTLRESWSRLTASSAQETVLSIFMEAKKIKFVARAELIRGTRLRED